MDRLSSFIMVAHKVTAVVGTLGAVAVLCAAHYAQGPVRPVPLYMNDIAIREEVHFRETGQYADPTETPEMKDDLTRIKEEGYEGWIVLGYDKDEKMNSYHVQAWKDRDCNNGARMSYYIQEQDVLRYRCSTENGVAGADDAKVE
jgi:hypothetical protein